VSFCAIWPLAAASTRRRRRPIARPHGLSASRNSRSRRACHRTACPPSTPVGLADFEGALGDDLAVEFADLEGRSEAASSERRARAYGRLGGRFRTRAEFDRDERGRRGHFRLFGEGYAKIARQWLATAAAAPGSSAAHVRTCGRRGSTINEFRDEVASKSYDLGRERSCLSGVASRKMLESARRDRFGDAAAMADFTGGKTAPLAEGPR